MAWGPSRRRILADIQIAMDDLAVPTPYFTQLAGAATARLPPPVSEKDVGDIHCALWMLLLAASAGRHSSDYTALQALHNAEDMRLWADREDPPALLQPELLKRVLERHLRSKIDIPSHPQLGTLDGWDFESLDLLADTRFPLCANTA